MADVKISALPAASALTGTELVPIVQGGVTVQSTPAAFVSNGTLAVSGTNLSYTGTLTGGTGVVNIGSGQLVKDASGNLGLGVTPSAWSGLKAFEFAGVGSSLASAANNNVFLSANAWYNGTNWRYGITAAASQYQSFSGQHAWYTAPSGTAGNAITFTQAMTLDAGGNLGLGVTPSAWSQGRAIELLAPGMGLWNGSGSPSSIYMTGNAYFNGGFKYGVNGEASHYYQYLGQHVWSTAPSGTAGNAISFTQAMTLDASGILIVGTTSVIGSATQKVQSTNGFISATDDRGLRLLNTAQTGGGAINANTGTNGGITVSSDAGPLLMSAGGAERARIDSSGNLITNVNAAAPSLSTNSTMSFELTSNTSLKVVVRGTDGVTRSVSLTLS